ncbi:unnamed protein product [Caretta caretta]
MSDVLEPSTAVVSQFIFHGVMPKQLFSIQKQTVFEHMVYQSLIGSENLASEVVLSVTAKAILLFLQVIFIYNGIRDLFDRIEEPIQTYSWSWTGPAISRTSKY